MGEFGIDLFDEHVSGVIGRNISQHQSGSVVLVDLMRKLSNNDYSITLSGLIS